ncbi:MAG: HAMP domain-containing sensor histidine kinase [Eubacteriales bacterium]|nr:HAMP domain-containing sensor histidine kinase [Eubacteriales bacterium]HMM01138.1 HAMP domain-containing sensor histidine kinase [Bacilli bacterium]
MRSNMRLRTKMTFWYTAFTFVVITVFCIFLYWVVSSELQQSLQNETTMAMSQLISQIENENGMITFENEVPVSQNIMFYITEDNGSEIASYGKDITVFDQVPIHENEYSTAKGAESDWLLLDSALIREDHFALRVRVAASYAHNQQVLSILLLLFFIGVPSITIILLLGGFGIAKRSLMPIRKIITSAEIISQGNLSERIPPTHINDEIGELTDALNGMLASVEASFDRERQFSSDASHELRTPVTVVRAYTETLMNESALIEEHRESLQTILTECTRMEKIISQLLIITRGQEKCYPICIETIKLKDVVESVTETMEEQLREKGIKMISHCSANMEIQADQSLLTQMLLNLVENAVKYGKRKGTINLSVNQNNEAIILSIKDNGIGIPEESLPHIFDRFYRVDASRNRNGSGLGLSIVKWIVETHQGSIDVRSKLGHGTEFVITVPKL